MIHKEVTNIMKHNTGLLIISVVFIILASFFELSGISLIIPLSNQLLSGGSFLNSSKIPFLDSITKVFPAHSNLSIVSLLVILMLISIWLNNIFVYLSSMSITKLSMNVMYTLRVKVFSKYLSLGKAFFDKNNLGGLISIMLDNVRELSMLLMSMRVYFVNIIMICAFLIFLSILSWKFTLMVLPLVAFIYYPLEWLIKKLKSSSHKHVLASMDLYSYSTDILSNMPLVISHVSEDYERERFRKKNKEMNFHFYNVQKKDNIISRLSDIIASSGLIVLIFIFIATYMKLGNFSLGKLLVYFFALMRLVSYLKPINDFKGKIAKLIPLLEKISWVFDDSDKQYVRSGNLVFTGLKEKIAFKNLDFNYLKDKQILKNINFEIKKNSITAIVGPTGSGKTTISSLLCRFYDFDEGKIEIDGVGIENFSLSSLRENIALVAQDPMLLNDTIGNNVAYGIKRKVSQDELDWATRQAYIYDSIMKLPGKFETYIGDRGVRLSGGEKQRIAIANAILKNAEILILDEAMSALDSETELLIQKAIENLLKGKTVLVIAHRFSTIKNADWIIVIENGIIVEQGKLNELLEKKSRFHYYWELQKFY